MKRPIKNSLRSSDSRDQTGGRENLEKLLLEGLDSGVSEPMASARKKQIYQQALKESGAAEVAKKG
jgi:hypothetical protein